MNLTVIPFEQSNLLQRILSQYKPKDSFHIKCLFLTYKGHIDKDKLAEFISKLYRVEIIIVHGSPNTRYDYDHTHVLLLHTQNFYVPHLDYFPYEYFEKQNKVIIYPYIEMIDYQQIQVLYKYLLIDDPTNKRLTELINEQHITTPAPNNRRYKFDLPLWQEYVLDKITIPSNEVYIIIGKTKFAYHNYILGGLGKSCYQLGDIINHVSLTNELICARVNGWTGDTIIVNVNFIDMDKKKINKVIKRINHILRVFNCNVILFCDKYISNFDKKCNIVDMSNSEPNDTDQ